MRRMNQLGIITRASRSTALHLASTTLPAVFASLIGIHITTADPLANPTGSAWNSPRRHPALTTMVTLPA